MKKFLLILTSIVFLLGIDSCSCNKEVDSNTETSIENLISMDRETMFLEYGEDYRWFETGIQLKDWLDEENDGSIEMVVNVFQAIESKDSTSFDTFVIKFQHIEEDVYEEAIHGFWIEDLPLNNEEINITFKEAYDRIMMVNLPKPHTRQVVLRKQIGPKPCNPQWIFGNLQSQIYVDAVTGYVTDINPVFDGLQYSFTW